MLEELTYLADVIQSCSEEPFKVRNLIVVVVFHLGKYILHTECFLDQDKNITEEQGWCSGESTRLPPIWPGFGSRTQRHMWIEFVVGSRTCSKRFFSGFSGFPLSSKTNSSKFQFDLESVPIYLFSAILPPPPPPFSFLQSNSR